MKSYDLVIIGGGPGGYVAAIRAAQAGVKTAIIEKHKLGGCCLNWGCVPARRLMESAKFFSRVQTQAGNFGIDGIDSAALKFNWKKAVAEKDKIVTKLVKGVEFLMKKNGVDVISGEAAVTGDGKVVAAEQEIGFGKLIIATGSRPDHHSLSAHLKAQSIVEIDDLFTRSELPQKFAILGGCAVACELANMLRLIGKDVTLITKSPRLIRKLDPSLSSFLQDKFKKLGIKIFLDSNPPLPDSKGLKVGEQVVDCDLIVNCGTRSAVLPRIEGVKFDMTDEGFFKTDSAKQTSVKGVYAIGDVTGTRYAQQASAHAAIAVGNISGIPVQIDESKIPINIYTDPEIAAVGATEEQLIERKVAFVKGDFPMQVNSKAMVEGSTEGFARILADEKYGEVLGAQIISSKATDLISALAFGMNLEATLEDLFIVVHPHPTVSETVMEAGFKALGKPLHL